LVRASTCASAVPDPPPGFVVGGFEVVVVRVGFGDGLGVRVPSRLGLLVDRVGVGVDRLVFDGVALGFGVGVRVGVSVGRTGVDDGLVGVREVSADASSVAVMGDSWPVILRLSVSRTTNHPMPISRTKADSEAMRGPATPLPGDRLWFVMVCSFAQPGRL
jgi:hypothetical protein